MPWLKIDDAIVHVRMSQKPRRRCNFCNTGWVELLCDYPVSRRRTCSTGMCAKCATPAGDGIDYCPNHRGRQPAQALLPLSEGEDIHKWD